MKKIKIINEPKRVLFELIGSFSDLSPLSEILRKAHLSVYISRGPFMLNSESSDHEMAIECPEANYDTVLALVQDYMQK